MQRWAGDAVTPMTAKEARHVFLQPFVPGHLPQGFAQRTAVDIAIGNDSGVRPAVMCRRACRAIRNQARHSGTVCRCDADASSILAMATVEDPNTGSGSPGPVSRIVIARPPDGGARGRGWVALLRDFAGQIGFNGSDEES